MGLTIEQQRAIALAKARGRAKVRQTGGNENGYTPSGIGGVEMPILDRFNTFVNSAVDQIPIVGPALSDFGAGVDAAWASMIEGKPVTKEDRLAINKAQEAEYPIENVAGRVTGVVAPFLAAAPFAGASKVLGMSGSLGSQMGFGFGSGAVISGADAAARGGDLGDVISSTVTGGAVGGAFPVLTRGAKLAFDALKGNPMVARPVAKVADALTNRDKLTAAMVEQRLSEMGPGAVIGDLGENVRGQVGALATMPGDAKTIIADILNARHAATNSRITGNVDDLLGPSPVPSQVLTANRANMDALGPEYRRLFTRPLWADSQPIAENLDFQISGLRGEAQSALRRVRAMLNNYGDDTLSTDASTLFQTRQAIDGMMATETNPKAIGVLTATRQQIDEVLAGSVPGLKEVDAKFAELARQNEGLELGGRVLDSGKTAVRPAEMADDLAAGVQPEGLFIGPSGTAFRVSQGARAEIDRLIGTTANDLNALKTALKGDGSWNRQKLAQLFGEDRADALIAILDREQTFQSTYNAAFGNSKTAATTAAQKEFSPEVTGLPTSTTWTGLAASALTKGAGAAAGTAKTAGNAQAARLLMSEELPPALRAALAQAARLAKPSLVAPAAPAIGVTSEKRQPVEIVIGTRGSPTY